MDSQNAQLQAYYHWLRDRGQAYLNVQPQPVLDGLAGVRQQIAACQSCELGQGQRLRALGSGGASARVLFVGDGPLGSDLLFTTDEQDLLLKIVGALGLAEPDVYFTASVHCRMPDDRPPSRHSFDTCRTHMLAVTKALCPSAVVVLGGLAARALFGDDATFNDLRGRILREGPLGALPLVVTFHPRDLLRQPQAKRQAWTDLQLIKQFLV